MSKKSSVVIILFGAFIISWTYIMGKAYSAETEYPLMDWALWGKILLLTIVVGVVFALYVFLISRFAKKTKNGAGRISRSRVFTIWGALLICWIPIWLAAFPGFFTYDATTAFIQVFYDEVGYTAHNPLIHTLLLGGTIRLFYGLTGSYNAGVAFFCLVQMMLLAGCFTYTIRFLSEQQLPKWIGWIAALYYALCPVITIYSSCTTKDILSSMIVLLFVIKYRETFQSGPLNISSCVLTIMLGILSILSRKNILFAMGIFFVCQLIAKEKRKERMIVILCVILLGIASDQAIIRFMKAEPSSPAEMLSVPAQQIGRVIYLHGKDALNDIEHAGIEQYMYLENPYYPVCADSIKSAIKNDAIKGHIPEFLKYYLMLGIRYPQDYLDAFNYLTYEAWYPFTDVDGYTRNAYTFDPEGTSFFTCELESPVELHSIFPELYQMIWQFSRRTTIWKIPVIGLLCSIGFHLWILTINLGKMIIQRNQQDLLMILFPVAILFTCFMGPMVLIRYYMFLFYLFPIQLGLLIRS
ncbi:MAG: DUF6020 family protein [Lachnospiraceae bacterium]|nr:DUF6020 family protein [Lachnospiraceae bacterium]